MIQKILVITILLLISIFVHTPVANAAIVINEIFPKPTDETSEWIELYNTGLESVSLDRWKIENTQGTIKTFTANASAIIPPHGFITLYQSQTGILLSNNGDSIKLFNSENTLIDTQGYAGILGYNTSMGRSIDGNGSWTLCTTPATPNKTNNCPAPSVSPTPTPEPSTPTPTRVLTHSPTPTLTITIIPTNTPPPEAFFSTANAPAQSQVLGAFNDSPRTENSSSLHKKIGIGSLCVAALAALGLIILRRKKKK